MKPLTVAIVMLGFVGPPLAAAEEGGAGEKVEAADAAPGEVKALTDKSARISYMVGLQIGASLKDLRTQMAAADSKLDARILARAITDVLEENPRLLSPGEARKVRDAFQKKMQAAHSKRRQGLSDKNEKEGRDFLAGNAKKDGVTTTASGLQYEVMEEGTGDSPKATDTVSVHYRGTLINGTEFDSSHKRGKPAEFPLNGVIPGWTEGVQLMKVGSKFRFFVPPELAYGARGAGAIIGPNSTLIFEVELLQIK